MALLVETTDAVNANRNMGNQTCVDKNKSACSEVERAGRSRDQMISVGDELKTLKRLRSFDGDQTSLPPENANSPIPGRVGVAGFGGPIGVG